MTLGVVFALTAALIATFAALLWTRSVFSPLIVGLFFLWTWLIGSAMLVMGLPMRTASAYYVAGSIVFTVLGAGGVNLYLHFVPSFEVRRFRDQPWVEHTRFFRFRMCLTAVLIASITAIGASALFVIQGIPLLGGGNVYLQKVSFGASFGYLNRLIVVFNPLLVIFVLLYWEYRRTRLASIAAFGWIGYTVVVGVLTGYRSMLMFTGILLLMAYCNTQHLTRLRQGLLLFTIGSIGAAGALIITHIAHGVDLATSIRLLIQRFTVEQARSYDWLVNDLIPRRGFFYGETLLWDFRYLLGTLRLVDRPPYVFQVFLYSELFGSAANLGLGAPPGLPGELYANFGLPGLALGSFLYGACLQLVYILMIRASKDVLKVWLTIGIAFVLIYFQAASIFQAVEMIGLSLLGFVSLYLFLFLVAGLPMGKLAVPSFRMQLVHSSTKMKS
jgi:hypothetical protein